MTATATPNAPNRGDWAWPLKPPLPSPSPPLELQFLPPSAAATAASETRTPPVSPWTVDPTRLQKLMMGSVASPPSSAPSLLPPVSQMASVIAPAVSAPALVPPISSPSPHAPDFGAFFDPGINKSLPSGWERCLDLKSGEVFIKKCDAHTHTAGVLPGQFKHHFTQCRDWKQACARPSRASEGTVQIDEQRLDWSLRWMQGKAAMPTQNLMSNNLSFAKADGRLYQADERSSSPDGQSVCLDLDLRLTSDNRSRLTSEASDVACSRSLKPVSSTHGSRDESSKSRVRPWKWQQLVHDNERPASIQEMVSESTMATAVCSKCLMYVLLKKSNPTCPRCFNPIILDCGIQPPPVKKRPRLELSPDDLSLSTDSSR